jgi:competence protein ComEC
MVPGVIQAPEKMICRPFIPLLLSLIAGIICGALFPGHPWPALIAGAGLLSAVLRSMVRRQAIAYLPLLLMPVLGYLSIQPWLCPRFPPDHIIHYADNGLWQINGTVVDQPVYRGDRCYLTLAARRLVRSEKRLAVAGQLRVTVAGGAPLIRRGDRLHLKSKIRTVRSFQNPGGFDYRQYLAFRAIWARTFVPTKHLKVSAAKSPAGIHAVIQRTRNHVEGLIDRMPPGDPRSVLKALLLGQKHGIDPQLRQSFNRLGVGHLLAISGLHVGIVASSAFFLFHFLLAFSPFLLRRGRVKQTAALLTLGPVLFYALLAGMAPSTQRAVVMVTVFLLCYVFGRDQDIYNTLAVAALIILIIYPPALFNISFQLSFSAVLAIVMGVSLITRPPSAKQPGPGLKAWPRRLGIFFMISVFAQIGTLPLIMRAFNQISLVGPPANFLLVPIIAFVVIPIGLSAVFLSFLYPPAAFGLFLLDGYILEFALHLIRSAAQLPFAAVRTFTPSLFEMGCFYVLIGSLFAWRAGIRNADAYRPDTIYGPPVNRRRLLDLQPGGWIRGMKWPALALLTIVLLCADTVYWLHQRFWRRDLRVTVIDVGQGSANLLELPRGYCVLIDGGGFSDNSVFDVGARVIAPLLLSRKIMTVELIILTHANSDHLNGLIHIAEHFNAATIWTNGEPHPTEGYRELMAVVDRRDIDHPPFGDLPREQTINGVTIQILYPPADHARRCRVEKWRSQNNGSIVVRTLFGDSAFLFPGDIQSRAERELNRLTQRSLRSQVLLAAHHGSRSSSSGRFVDAVRPRIVVFSCGWQNRFGFPHPEVLARFEDRNCRIYRTDYNGAVILTTDGRHLKVFPHVAEDHGKPIDFISNLK